MRFSASSFFFMNLFPPGLSVPVSQLDRLELFAKIRGDIRE
jgi:hypothetical protein